MRLPRPDDPDPATPLPRIGEQPVAHRIVAGMNFLRGTLHDRFPARRAAWGPVPVDRALGRLIGVVTALAFAILVSFAASHLHIGADLNESCPICTAFGVGKLKTPAPSIVAAAPVAVTWFWLQPERPPTLAQSVRVVVLPPSCGPPAIA